MRQPVLRFNGFSVLRIVRAVGEVSLVAIAIGFVVLLVGLPIAASAWLIYEGLSWLALIGGKVGAVVERMRPIASAVGGVALASLLARVLVGFFRWRRTPRAAT